MSPNIAPQPRITQTSLVDEVMSILRRGESALFNDLARATWDSHATLGDLTGTLRSENQMSQRAAA